METNRSTNVILNTFWLCFSQVITIIVNLISNRVFLHHLGSELLGVNNLFVDILTVFSFADLGIGTAIAFSLYEPIAKQNKKKIKELLQFYKTVFRFIIVILIVVGLTYVPFLRYLKTNIEIQKIIIYYLLILFNFVMEYLFAYREAYITAKQNMRKLTQITLYTSVIKTIVQIVIVKLTNNYILFLIANSISIVMRKLLINNYVKEKYQETKTSKKDSISQEEKKIILSKSNAMFIQKIGTLGINQTGSIIVSYIVGVDSWGLLSIYLLLRKAIQDVLAKIYSAFLPSFGDYIAQNDISNEKEMFYIYSFINEWIYIFCFIALETLASPFVVLFYGKEFVVNKSLSFFVFFCFFYDGLRNPISALREASGDYDKDKRYTIIATIVNIVLSILFVSCFGTIGVYYGFICAVTILHYYRSKYIINNRYNESSITYFISLILSIGKMIVCYIPTKLIVELLFKKFCINYLNFVFAIVIITILPNVIYLKINKNNIYLKIIINRYIKPWRKRL